ncbi:hypothetical protein MTR_0116s0130 [Medicago truncatula]|uniref:Chromo domain-containing protein n=1 Tax=Medicago truncatula TaxID=3880 RepID=A0A072TH26_MEDTR|nr:hypothetical protein MTR_0116s0130 [Medicago truncatula]
MGSLLWVTVLGDTEAVFDEDDIPTTFEKTEVRIEHRKVKRFRGKEIVLVKVIWIGPTGASATWESESRMKV